MNFRLSRAAAVALGLALSGPAMAQIALLDPVVVTATRVPTRVSETVSDVSVITREEIERAGPATLAEVLRAQAGVEIIMNGGPGQSAGALIRGASAGQTLVLVDGLRFNAATFGSASIGAFPLDQVERIEILRGPASSLYGADAVGGVIQIFTRRGEGRPRADFSAGYGRYNTFEGNAGYSGEVGDTRFSARLGYTDTEGFSAIANPANLLYNPDRDGYTNGSFSGAVSHRIRTGHEIGASVLYADGRTQYDGVAFDGAFSPFTDYDYRTRQRLHAASVYSRNRITPDWESTLRLGQSGDRLKVSFLEDFTLAETSQTTTTLQDQVSWQNDFDTRVGRLMLAAEYVRDRVSGDVAYDVERRHVRSVLGGYQGTFGANEFQASVRYDDNSQFGGKTTGSIAYGYQFLPNWRATVGGGTAFKAPSFNDLYYPGFGNPNLQPEESRSVEGGVRYESAAVRASAIVYQNRVDDLISFVCDPATFFCRPVNVDRARLRGVTLTYAAFFGGWELGASLDLADPEDADTGKRLRYRARERGAARVFRTLGPWRFGVELVAVGDRYADAANTQKVAGYGLVNLHASYEVTRDWSLFARLDNALDKDYEVVKDYGTPGASFFAGVRYQPR